MKTPIEYSRGGSSREQPLPHSQKIGSMGVLFILFCAYTAIPVLEVPVIGLSLSAPLFFFFVMHLLFKVGFKSYPGMGQVWGMGWFILGGILTSALANAFFSQGENFGAADVLAVVRYGYWILVYIFSAYFLARKPELGSRVITVLAGAVFILSLMRWFEGIVYGKIGAWTEPRFMSQNSYAGLFSMYAPFLFVIVLGTRKKRFYAIVGSLVVLGAIIINGSRSNWIAITVSLAIIGWLYILANPAELKSFIKILMLFLALLAAGFVFWKFAPQSIRTTFEKRLSTMESLETDKSYQTRKVLQKKAALILKEDPLFGCGPGRFTKTSVYLEIPKILRAFTQEKINRTNSHNSYMELLSEGGLSAAVPTAFLFLFLILEGFKASLYFVREKKFWPMGIYVSFLSMGIHMWTISAFTNTATWLKLGMVAGIIVIAKRSRIEKVRLKKQGNLRGGGE